MLDTMAYPWYNICTTWRKDVMNVEVTKAINGYVVRWYDTSSGTHMEEIHTQFDSMVHRLRKLMEKK